MNRDANGRQRESQRRRIERGNAFPGGQPLPESDRPERDDRRQTSAKPGIRRLQRLIKQREQAETCEVHRNQL